MGSTRINSQPIIPFRSRLAHFSTLPLSSPSSPYTPADLMPAARSSPRATRASSRSKAAAFRSSPVAKGGAAAAAKGGGGIQSPSHLRTPLATKTNIARRQDASEEAEQPLPREVAASKLEPRPPGKQRFLTPGSIARVQSLDQRQSIDSDLEAALLADSQEQQPLPSLRNEAELQLRQLSVPPPITSTPINRHRVAHPKLAAAGPSKVAPSPIRRPASATKLRKYAPPLRERSADSDDFENEYVEESRDTQARTQIPVPAAIPSSLQTQQQQQQRQRPATPSSGRGRMREGVPRASTPVPGRSYLDEQMLHSPGDRGPDFFAMQASGGGTPSSSAQRRRLHEQQRRGSGSVTGQKRRFESPSHSATSQSRRHLQLPSDATDEEVARTKEARTAAFVRSASQAARSSSQQRQLYHHKGAARTPAGSRDRDSAHKAGQGSERRSIAGEPRSEHKRRDRGDRRDTAADIEDSQDPFGFFRAEERIKRRRMVSAGYAALVPEGMGAGDRNEDTAFEEMIEKQNETLRSIREGGLGIGDDTGNGSDELQMEGTGREEVREEGREDGDEDMPDVLGVLTSTRRAIGNVGQSRNDEDEDDDDDAILRRILGSADDASSDPAAGAADKRQKGDQEGNSSSSDTDDYAAPSTSKRPARGGQKGIKGQQGKALPAQEKKAAPRRAAVQRGSRRATARGKAAQGSDEVSTSSSSDVNAPEKWRVDKFLDQVLPRRYVQGAGITAAREKAASPEKRTNRKRARFADDPDDEDEEDDSHLGPTWSSSPVTSPVHKAKGKGKQTAKKSNDNKKARATAKRGKASSKVGAKSQSSRAAAGKKAVSSASRATKKPDKGGSATRSKRGASVASAPKRAVSEVSTALSSAPSSPSASPGEQASSSSNYGQRPPTHAALEDRRRRGDHSLDGYEFEEELVLDR
ncbi:hypothetical protein BDZ90DRAFT_192360 [Jaminaea rosea]|uniref:Uncharacterized protein n=1 Tax=Jaminaea rosea TaxID=1569628 RepID=A0A316UNC8_9BASI|nr:hypothetical protein BDZ90DRAFT_192360 [Jaminaea rosea]PWN26797.1 hypothetical protein BDZ90DRAFT_192360 [Jaminaea rosea]